MKNFPNIHDYWNNFRKLKKNGEKDTQKIPKDFPKIKKIVENLQKSEKRGMLKKKENGVYYNLNIRRQKRSGDY